MFECFHFTGDGGEHLLDQIIAIAVGEALTAQCPREKRCVERNQSAPGWFIRRAPQALKQAAGRIGHDCALSRRWASSFARPGSSLAPSSSSLHRCRGSVFTSGRAACDHRHAPAHSGGLRSRILIRHVYIILRLAERLRWLRCQSSSSSSLLPSLASPLHDLDRWSLRAAHGV